MKAFIPNQKLYFGLLFLLNFTNCKNENQTDLKESQTNSNGIPWSQISIRLDGQTIDIYDRNNSPSFSRLLVPKDTVIDFMLTSQQKDSIYNLVSGIIENPIVPDHLITEQVAQTATFSIFYEKKIARSTSTTTIKKIDFQFIQSWGSVSDKTKKLSLILSRKIKLIR